MSTMDERTAIRSRTRAGLARLAGPWWMFLLTGIAWLILAWIALRFAPASIPTVGVLLGVYFLVAAINEFFIASVMPSWRWLHILMGVIFAFGAFWSFARPYNAFWALASILGLLLIFQGTLYVITSVSARQVSSTTHPLLALGMVPKRAHHLPAVTAILRAKQPAGQCSTPDDARLVGAASLRQRPPAALSRRPT